MPPPPGGVRRYHVVAEQITKRRVENQPASGVEHRPDVPECIPYHQELEAIDMRPLVQEFLPQGPKVRQFRRHLDLGARRPGKMCAASAIADDPMIDGLAPEVALRAQRCEQGARWCGSSPGRRISIVESPRETRCPSGLWVSPQRPMSTIPAKLRADPAVGGPEWKKCLASRYAAVCADPRCRSDEHGSPESKQITFGQ